MAELIKFFAEILIIVEYEVYGIKFYSSDWTIYPDDLDFGINKNRIIFWMKSPWFLVAVLSYLTLGMSIQKYLEIC